MAPYNLTDSQKNLLRLLVDKVRSGTEREPFLGISLRDGLSLHPVGGGEPIEVKDCWQGDFDVLAEADLVLARLNSSGRNYLYSIKQAGYDAVDTDFSAPDTSFVVNLTPLADVEDLPVGTVGSDGA